MTFDLSAPIPEPPVVVTSTSTASSAPRKPTPSTSTDRSPGTGAVHLSPGGFSELHASYPLKLLAPRHLPSQPASVSLLYTLAYGGGLVSGDVVQLKCTVDAGQTLVLRTQGSTKVYKHRPGLRPASHGISRALSAAVARGEEAPAVRQRMLVELGAGATLILLPDALSPFRSSRYIQAQRVVLPKDGSGNALVLDWLNSGRGDRPVGRPEVRPWSEGRRERRKWTELAEEEAGNTQGDWGKAEEEYWAMEYYGSTNELVLGPGSQKILARERMVLDNLGLGHDPSAKEAGLSPIARSLAPYHVYATVLVYGDAFAKLCKHLDKLADATSQFQVPRPPGLLWSWSNVGDKCGIVRVAGLEVEDVRDWLRGAMEEGGVDQMVGPGLWPRCI